MSKLLAFYLPQFHEIPENNEWWGKGFTDWTNVRKAKTLVSNQYQPREPLNDNYYDLSDVEVMKWQSKIAQEHGIYGFCYYHYWFNGKLLLEKPLENMLKDKDVTIPFCFSWANEPWARTWDGQNSNILMAQEYGSEKEWKDFIEYLIPFFKDERYIKVDNKPIIFIYRPASFPNFEVYKKIWKEFCKKNELDEPFIVGTLTRGAMDPRQYSMDAAVERVLHDWTGKKVKSINESLFMFKKIKNDILDYKDVANFYMSQNEKREFTYFRSIIPMWDNTARYSENAHIVHNSTPEQFELWLDNLILYSKKHLPKEKRFIIINAWN